MAKANAWEGNFMKTTKRHESYLVRIFTVFLVEFISEQEPGYMPLWLGDGIKGGASIHHVGTGKGERVTVLHHYQKFKVLFKANDPCQ